MLTQRNATRKDVNDAICNLSKASGLYHGVPYNGKVTGNRGITTSPYDIEIYIELDTPIVVYSYERTTITINGGDVYDDTASSTRYATTANEIWKE